MAGATNASLPQNQTLDRLFTALDPKSLILSQFSNSQNPNPLRLTTEYSFTMERGPRYEAYANLRESKLRMKRIKQSPPQDPESNLIPQIPPMKQLKYQGSLPSRRKGSSSVLTQSVPDFSSALRKENRKPPAAALPPVMEKSATPPAKSSRSYGIPARLGGSKSANSGEKRSGGLLARKSYASVEELKGISSAAASAINGENRGIKSGRTVGKTILGYRQY